LLKPCTLHILCRLHDGELNSSGAEYAAKVGTSLDGLVRMACDDLPDASTIAKSLQQKYEMVNAADKLYSHLGDFLDGVESAT
jgi:hypothetical protein